VWPLLAPVTIERTIENAAIKFYLNTPSDFELVINDIDVEQKSIIKFVNTLEEGDVVYDIGANIGTYAILADNKLSECTVVAFEPLPENVVRLEDNIEANKSSVEVRDIALSNSIGSANFTANHSKTGRLVETNTLDPSTTVEKTKGDIFVDNRDTPTVIKIDSEGEELDILRGFDETLAEGVRDIFVEIHEPDYGDAGLSIAEVNELKQYLTEKGFRLTQIQKGSNTQMVHASRE
jgi:FkbM family methyltransferase